MLRSWLQSLRRRWPVVAIFSLVLVILSYQYFGAIYHGVEKERGRGRYLPLIAVQDGHKIYLQVMSVVLDRELDIDDEARKFGYPGHRWRDESGHLVYPHGIGLTIAWAPAFALAHGTSKIANALGADIPDHGYTLFHQRFVFYTSVLCAWLVAIIGYRAARRLVGGTWIPILAAMAVLFGTNLSYYAVHRPDYGHTISALLCALFLDRWLATIDSRSWRRFIALGGLLGAAALVRSANLFLGIVVAIEVATWVARAPRDQRSRCLVEAVRCGSLALGASLVVFSVQMLVWMTHYESGFFSPPQGSSYVHLGRPMLAEFLYSAHNGFFSTHPVALFGTAGLLMAPRRLRLVALSVCATVAVMVYVNSCVYDWWAMSSYGARRMCCMSLALILGMAFAMRSASSLTRRVPVWARRGAAILLLSWFVIWNQSYAESARKRHHSTPMKMCCDEVPDFMSAIAEPIHECVGNPFALPASLLWSWRWGVPVTRYDEVVIGKYAARPAGTDFVDGSAGQRVYGWNIPGVHFDPWIVRDLGPRQRFRNPDKKAAKDKRWIHYRWTTGRGAAVFVPLFLPRDHHFELPLRPNLADGELPVRVRLIWNRDQVVYDRAVDPGWTIARFTVAADDVKRGTNMLDIEVEPSAYRSTGHPALAPLKGSPSTPVGLAVQQLKIRLDDAAR